jgi:hypothetical protein
MDVPASSQHSGVSDPVLNKATTAIAAKMEAPASIEFQDMKRAIRKDTFGQPIDTICGHAKGKKISGEETGERPFLYVVKENKVFVDDGNPDSVAATAYRAICTSPELRRQDFREWFLCNIGSCCSDESMELKNLLIIADEVTEQPTGPMSTFGP